MRNTQFVLLFLLAITWLQSHSQTPVTDPQKLIADIIEDLSAGSESELDLSSIVEDLNQLYSNPININDCTIDDLSRLSFLTDFQIQSLWDYIQTNKPVLNIFELQLVYGFEKDDVLKLGHFIKLDSEMKIESLKTMISSGKHELIQRVGAVIESQNGYENSQTGYLGSKYNLLTRYNYTYSNKLQWGVVGEKDPGEELFQGANSSGYDYLSGYIFTSNLGMVKKAVVGDFDVEFGQGLNMWSSLTSGKSTNPIGGRKRARGIKPHSSTNENRYLRGAGVILTYKKLDFAIFCSAKKVDANIEDSTIDGDIIYSSLPESGLHRTASENLNKRNLNELIVGSNIMLNLRKVKSGICISQIQYDGNFTVETSPTELFQQFQKSRTTASLYTDINLKRHFIFSELSVEPTRNEYAFLVGGVFKLSSTIDYSIVLRDYSKGYNSIYTSGFSESSSSSNERGVFSGLSMNLFKGIKLSAILDIYKFPWLKYRVNAPSLGYDYLIQADYRINPDLFLLFRYRQKNVQENFDSESMQLATLVDKKTQGIRFQLDYNAPNNISLQSRFDFNVVKTDSAKSEKGFLISQDIGYEIPKIPLTFAIRYAIFDTDSWNSRIYAYENDLLYSFSVPAYYSKGSRIYFMVKYNFLRRYDIWFRWSQTYYHNLDVIGSGLDQIDGSKKNDFRVMVRVRF